jgi:hypothetical protein
MLAAAEKRSVQRFSEAAPAYLALRCFRRHDRICILFRQNRRRNGALVLHRPSAGESLPYWKNSENKSMLRRRRIVRAAAFWYDTRCTFVERRAGWIVCVKRVIFYETLRHQPYNLFIETETRWNDARLEDENKRLGASITRLC